MAYGDRSGPLGAAASTTIAATDGWTAPRLMPVLYPCHGNGCDPIQPNSEKSILESFLIHLNLLHTLWAFCT
jgi:hypothetical protein